MTKSEFRQFITDPHTSTLLDRMLEDNARVDADLEAKRAQNDAVFDRWIQSFWAKTDPQRFL